MNVPLIFLRFPVNLVSSIPCVIVFTFVNETLHRFRQATKLWSSHCWKARVPRTVRSCSTLSKLFAISVDLEWSLRIRLKERSVDFVTSNKSRAKEQAPKAPATMPKTSAICTSLKALNQMTVVSPGFRCQISRMFMLKWVRHPCCTAFIICKHDDASHKITTDLL